jgi:hypothetical protein
MSESGSRGSAGQTSSSTALVVVLWAIVLIPLLWGIYQTLTGVVALFS